MDEPVRIARFLARAGVASRRQAEKLIEAGRVTLNGQCLTALHHRVTLDDDILVDGKPVATPKPAMLWRLHKPAGYVTTTADEKGRKNVFELLPPEMPRVVTVGRLDLNSEGLLLLTNDGSLKRHLELPANGFSREYRVRARGRPDEVALDRLRKGLRIGSERFRPMTIDIETTNAANSWYSVRLKEGRNREIRRAFEAIDLTVNRLIRVSFGPFRLGKLASGQVERIPEKAFCQILPNRPEKDRDRSRRRKGVVPPNK